MSKRDEKRAEILEFVTGKVTEEGYVPSVREICKAVGLSSPATVHYHLNQLCEEGLISKEPNKKRFIRLSNQSSGTSYVKVPLVGRVTAGQPILAREEIEDYIQIPADCIRGRDTFALTVRGDSMINAGILDGDIIVVLRTPVAEDGEIVVALLGEEATVKRFYRDGRRIRLQPENDAYSPIYADEVKILGKVIALHRYEIR
ncbi:MAG: transcriptional repressor LexA [Clostridia bacterium]|nr:transcriptional repressor LexA [Clostridia bacterium]MBQ2273059.1 transcriptional repressor LexA [Clostridia bacterium]MBQ5819824.1 transcriptional repressor LexA [Clostridia bacterium]